MSALVVEPMNAAAHWRVLEPDGVTPSTELTISDDALMAGYGPDGVSARITASSAASGHILRRGRSALDISAFTELRLSLRASRAAGGTKPFFLQLRLGSAARPLSDPANTWHRMLPLLEPNRWETIKFGIDDLDVAISGSMSQLELRCLDLEAAFTAHVDDLTAVLPEMLADTDRALEARLAGISVGDSPAPALVRASAEPVPPAVALDLTHFDLCFAAARVRDVLEPRDHTTGGGMRLVPVGDPYDITYSVAPVANTRSDQAALMETLVRRLAPFDELIADGDRLPLELIQVRAEERAGGAPGADPVLFYRVGTRAWHGAPPPVREVSEITVNTERMEAV
jgi:hypothetical protein